MPLTRHFLGWDEPVAAAVRRYLLPAAPRGPVRGADTLVVAPTRQAGRRLREALARFCAQHDSALLGLRVVPPSFFVQPDDLPLPLASPSLMDALWAELLLAVEPADYPGFFGPTARPERTFAWALETGALIRRLRAELAEAGCRIADVPRRGGAALEEPERWRDLSRLETLYLQRLERAGRADPCVEEIRRAAAPAVPEGVRRVVLACVPDPPPLVVEAWERLAQRLALEALIHAPPELEAAFDAWGRPRREHWESARLDIPDPEADLICAAGPEEQSREVLRLLAEEQGRFGPADVAVGVPDRAVLPDLELRLAQHGLPAFDPADRPLGEHPLARLVAAFAALARDRSYAALSALLRQPDALECFCAAAAAAPLDLLTELDEFQNQHLPLTIDDLAARAAAPPPPDARRREFGRLQAVVRLVLEQLERFAAAPAPGAGLREFLQTIYAARSCNLREPADAEFRAAAEALDECLRELDEAAALMPGRLGKPDALSLLLRQTAVRPLPRERAGARIDLEGWLELPWNDAPFLIVTGMNEGSVPESRPADVFLPDALRGRIGLRDDAARFARDAYLTAACLASRRAGGRVCFIAGRFTREGDPLRPSRLLLRCGDEELPARAARFFRPLEAERALPAATVSFRLRSRPPPDLPEAATRPTRVSVTALRDYLACPFRFYLKQVLGMKTLDDAKSGPDVLDFGLLVHSALRRLAEDRRCRACADPRRLAEFLARQADRWIEARYGAAPALPVRVAREAARERLAAAAAVQARLAEQGWEIVRAEHKREWELAGLTLVGKIDRLDRHRETGALRIIDYKTSDAAETPAAAHLAPAREETPEFARVTAGGRPRRWIDLQLPAYRWMCAAEAPPGAAIELAYFNLPKAVTETALEVWEDFDEPLLRSAAACAQTVAERIRGGVFWPPAPRVEHDDFEPLYFTTPERAFEPPSLP